MRSTKVKPKQRRCLCGKVIGWAMTQCNECHKRHMEGLHERNRAIVATGQCPQCGAALKRNLSITGWWQCEQYGADTRRRDPSKPACSFQCFTE